MKIKTLNVNVANGVATYSGNEGEIVCGNSNYEIKFHFDEEWDAYSGKIARFVWNGEHYDVDFTGDTCPVPIISDTPSFDVGVYAGDLSTTTPATVYCKRSILCGDTKQRPENVKIYANEARAAAVAAKDYKTEAEAAANKSKEEAEKTTEAAAEVAAALERVENSGRLSVTDDGEGNVTATITGTGTLSVTDDGDGNVTMEVI